MRLRPEDRPDASWCTVCDNTGVVVDGSTIMDCACGQELEYTRNNLLFRAIKQDEDETRRMLEEMNCY